MSWRCRRILISCNSSSCKCFGITNNLIQSEGDSDGVLTFDKNKETYSFYNDYYLLPCQHTTRSWPYTDICIHLSTTVYPTILCAPLRLSGKTNALRRWILVLDRNNQVRWPRKSNGSRVPKINIKALYKRTKILIVIISIIINFYPMYTNRGIRHTVKISNQCIYLFTRIICWSLLFKYYM